MSSAPGHNWMPSFQGAKIGILVISVTFLCSVSFIFLADDSATAFLPASLQKYIPSAAAFTQAPQELPWATFPEGTERETSTVQRLLHANQNPADCEKRKYFLWSMGNWGMGSDIHTAGVILGLALQHDRTLLYDSNDAWAHAAPDECGKTVTPDCYFAPLSRCQYMVENMTNVAEYNEADSEPWKDAQFVHTRWAHTWVHQRLIPRPKGGKLWPFRGLSWWRSQTTKYIIRPSMETMRWTENYFAEHLHRRPLLQNWSSETHPAPKDAICIHIRRGDKANEMRLHEIEEYLQAAEELIANKSASSNIFLTTDDEAIIKRVEEEDETVFQRKMANLTFYYTSYNRSAVNDDRGHYARPLLANLILSVHPACRWFVQTTGSNICRMINEIRKTDGRRRNATWIDLQADEWRL